MLNLSEEQIVALAPDPASVKAGMGLSAIKNWQSLGAGNASIWGLCQGSGSSPYKTQVDLQDLASKCSCPSRKFPCKHGLALLLIYSRQKNNFPESKPPDWVNDWVVRRREKQTLPGIELPQKEETNSRQKGVEKRAEARQNKVSSGLEGLRIWFADLAREGMLSYLEKPPQYWTALSQRMIDAQCPGIAARFQGISARAFQLSQNNEGWLIRQLAQIHLLTEAWPQIEALPADFQQEIRTQIGFTVAKEEVMSQPGITDQWLVLGCHTTYEQKLTVESYWFWGIQSGKFGLYLQYIAPGQVPATRFVPGACVSGEWVYYPGINPVRGLFKQVAGTHDWQMPALQQTLSSASAQVAQAFAAHPFLERVPVWVSGVHFLAEEKQTWLIGAEGVAVPTDLTEDQRWLVLALTGGMDSDAFCLAGESGWAIAGICLQHQYYPILS